MKKIIGTTHTPPTRWSEIVKQYGKLLPKPVRSEVAVAVLPHPPLLPVGGERMDLAVRVARGYFAACMNAYGACRSLRAPTPESVKESGHIMAFANAIEKLRAYRLAPAAWSAFSIEVWQEYVVGGKGGAWDRIPSKRRGPSQSSQPKPAWVFSVRRLEERTGWFAYRQSKYAGGRVIFTPALAELARLHEALRCSLVRAQGLDEAGVKAIVKVLLPATRRERLVEQANDEAEERMEKIKKRMKRGEWVWS